MPLHQRITGNLYVQPRSHVRERRLGEVFLSEGAPTLLVEVSSPSTRHLDRRRKFELYARHGVPHYWMVETGERAIEAYELTGSGYRLTRRAAGEALVSSPPFPALSFAPEALWRQ